jgi:hypothetical protein
MALDFPSSPTVGQVHSAEGIDWIWDGETWATAPRPPASGSARDFPNTPTTGDVLDDAWIWDGEKWRATRPQFVPEDFSLGAQTELNPSTTATSVGARITAARSGRPTTISISGGEYQTADDSAFSVNASAWASSAGTIAEGQYVRVRHTTSSSFSSGALCTLTIGPAGDTESDTFNSTTRAQIVTLLTTPGPGSWPVPPTFPSSNNTIEVIGGGAGGGGSSGGLGSAGGGGAGGYTLDNNHPLTPGGSAPYVVGGPGAGHPGPGTGTPGGTSTFNTTLQATGGTGGGAGPAGAGGPGGTGSGGDTNRTGGTGGTGAGIRSGGAGGASAGNAAGNGFNGGNSSPSSAGGGAGGAGPGGAGSPGPGGAGGGPGGTGGGGAGGGTGAAGSSGSTPGTSNATGGASGGPGQGGGGGGGGGYGAGGGGAGGGPSGFFAGGAGAGGAIRISY